MNKSKTRKILEDKLKDVKAAAETVAPKFSETSIHAFRVAIKKLRAYMRLIATDKEQPKMKLNKKLKTLYDIAGEIRDAQLKLKKTGRKAGANTYKKELEAIIAGAQDKWSKHYKESVVENMCSKLADKKISGLRPGRLVLFFKKRIEVLEEAADSKPDDTMIHECRKRVKDMQYNSKLAEKHWGKAYQKIVNLPLDKLNELSDLLGNYNDERLLLESHLSYMQQIKNKEERKIFTVIIAKGKRQKEKDKQALLKELKQFVTATAI